MVAILARIMIDIQAEIAGKVDFHFLTVYLLKDASLVICNGNIYFKACGCENSHFM